MFALMYDSDNETYPDDVQYIAAYVDGSRTGRNFQRARAKCPGARFLLISAVGEVDGDVIDIEPGNVWPPAEAVDWTIRQHARGANPGYYCNTSTRQQVLDAYAARGVDPGWWWRADYPGPNALSVFLPTELARGEVAWQFADPVRTGSHWDVSIIGGDIQAYLDGHGAAPAAAGGVVRIQGDGGGSDPGFLPWDGSSFNLAQGHFYGLITGPAESHGGAFGQEKPPITRIQQRLQELGFAPSTPGWADGIFGQPTADAVAAWQAVNRPGPLTTRPGEVWGDDWAALFSPSSIPAGGPAPVVQPPPPPPPPAMSFAPPEGAPGWPGGFGEGDFLGDIGGPAQSHGGDASVDGPDVIACITWVQRRMQTLRWTDATDPGWADGVFGQPTIDAVAAWQRERVSRVAGFAMAPDGFGRIFPDDYAALQGADNHING